MQTVFISYRHEDEAHRERVLLFARRLADALNGTEWQVAFDQFYLEKYHGGPPNGWPSWSAAQVKEADRILIVGTDGWFRSLDGTEQAGEGLGAACEANVIFQQLYDAGWISDRHRIVLFDRSDEAYVPLEFKRYHRFESDSDFDAIVGWLTGPFIPRPPARPRGIARVNPSMSGGLGWTPRLGHNPAFTGRKEDLTRLDYALAAAETVATITGIAGNNRAALQGMGGLGKTALAIEWAWSQWQAGHVHSVLSIDAISHESIIRDLAALAQKLAERLRWDLRGAIEAEALAARAAQWLADTPGWLLIADNCDTAAGQRALRHYLPEGLPGRVLITSRISDWPASCKPLRLEVLKPDEARSFLLAHSGEHHSDPPDKRAQTADTLADTLHYLPLALDQAAAFVRREAISFARYLDYWKTERVRLLSAAGDDPERHPDSTETTLRLAADSRSPLARTLLRLLAFYDADAVPRQIFFGSSDQLFMAYLMALGEGPDKRTAPSLDDQSIEAAIKELRDYSLIKLTEGHIAVHRLVQAVEQDRLTPEILPKWLSHAGWIACLNRWRSVSDAERTLATVRDHWQRVLNRDIHNSMWRRELMAAHSYCGNFLLAVGRLGAATAEYRAMQTLAENSLAENPTDFERQRDLSVCHCKVGEVLHEQGFKDEALREFRGGLAITKRLAAANPTDLQTQHGLSVLHGKIGGILAGQGHLDDALREYQADIAITERLIDVGGTDTRFNFLRSLTNARSSVGQVLHAQGKIDDALHEFRAVLAICERLLAQDPNDPGLQLQVAEQRQAIGLILRRQGLVDDALTEIRTSHAVIERLARQDPANANWQSQLALSHYELGKLLYSKGDIPGALESMEASKCIFESLRALDKTSAWLDAHASRSGAAVAQLHGMSSGGSGASRSGGSTLVIAPGGAAGKVQALVHTWD